MGINIGEAEIKFFLMEKMEKYKTKMKKMDIILEFFSTNRKKLQYLLLYIIKLWIFFPVSKFNKIIRNIFLLI